MHIQGGRRETDTFNNERTARGYSVIVFHVKKKKLYSRIISADRVPYYFWFFRKPFSYDGLLLVHMTRSLSVYTYRAEANALRRISADNGRYIAQPKVSTIIHEFLSRGLCVQFDVFCQFEL